MKTVLSFCGSLGAGKFYQMSKKIDTIKTGGNSIYLISFADPIKQVLHQAFGLTKQGRVEIEHPPFTRMYVKFQIVDSLYNLVKPLEYDQFKKITEIEFKGTIARIYERHEEEFYSFIEQAVLAEGIDYSLPFRRLGQLLGTELGREISNSIWVDIALYKITQTFKMDLANYAIIDDLRFMNEFNALQDFNKKYKSLVYGVIASEETRSIRRGLSIDQIRIEGQHASEKDIDLIIKQLEPEYIIDNN